MKPVIPFVHSLSDADAQAWKAALQRAASGVDIRLSDEIAEADRDRVEVAIVANADPADLAAFLRLKWVQSLWAGVDRILREMPDDEVQIVRLVDPQLGETMAEAVLAWTLFLHRAMPAYAAQQARRVWVQHDLPSASERKVGVLGLGHLGMKSADRLVQNGFDVLGWSRNAKDVPGVTSFSGTAGLSQMVAQSDIIVVLLPSTPLTRGLLDAQFFGDMKPGSSLINFARGDIVVRDDLIDALRTRHVDHAVLDVFAVEPLPQDDILWGNPHVTVLPHISAPTNKRTASAIAAQNIENYFATGQMPVTVSRRTGY